MPLQFEKDLLLPGEPILITADTLGVADISIANDKEDNPRRVSLHLYDKSGTSFLNCKVEVQNTREDSYHHVNILQEEECARFGHTVQAYGNEEAVGNAIRKCKVLHKHMFFRIIPAIRSNRSDDHSA